MTNLTFLKKNLNKSAAIKLFCLLLILLLTFGSNLSGVSAEILPTQETATLTADDAGDEDGFGANVAISNDTAVIGSPVKDGDFTDTGAAYIYERNANGADEWGQTRKITVQDANESARFGFQVAIDDDTLLVTAPNDPEGGNGAGAAYIFYRNEGGADQWGVVRKLLPDDVESGDNFGFSAAISGDTIVVSNEQSEDGAAYVFERNHGGQDVWGQVAKLSTPEGGLWGNFGRSVSIDNDTIVVGAPSDGETDEFRAGAAYVFERNQDGADAWGFVRRIVADGLIHEDLFGWSVAIDNDVIAIGALTKSTEETPFLGQAYVFERNVGGADQWGEVATLTPANPVAGSGFGGSVAIDDSTIAVGTITVFNTDITGDVTLFTRNQDGADNWGRVETLVGSTSEAGESLGISVALSHGNLIAGAPYESDGQGQLVLGAGKAYLFTTGEGMWQEVELLQSLPGDEDDNYGYSVDIDNDVAIVGITGFDTPALEDLGAAFILERNLDGPERWGVRNNIVIFGGIDLERVQHFGQAVAISGDTVVVGSEYKNDDDENVGAVFVFERNRGGVDDWDLVQTLFATVPENFDRYGKSVDISGDTIVVGAPRDDSGNLLDTGAAYVYERNQGGEDNWGLIRRLDGFPIASAEFGESVAIHNDTIVVGAWLQGFEVLGAAYVFERNAGLGDFGLVQTLTPSDPESDAFFGADVDISGDTIVVGAWSKDGDEGEKDAGAAYVYRRNVGGADEWGQVEKLTSPTQSVSDRFGKSVSIDGDIIAIGADQLSSNGGAGFVGMYYRNEGGLDNWGHSQTLTAISANADDKFGHDISLSGDALIISAVGLDSANQIADIGRGYIFNYDVPPKGTAIALNTITTTPQPSYVIVALFVMIACITTLLYLRERSVNS